MKKAGRSKLFCIVFFMAFAILFDSTVLKAQHVVGVQFNHKSLQSSSSDFGSNVEISYHNFLLSVTNNKYLFGEVSVFHQPSALANTNTFTIEGDNRKRAGISLMGGLQITDELMDAELGMGFTRHELWGDKTTRVFIIRPSLKRYSYSINTVDVSMAFDWKITSSFMARTGIEYQIPLAKNHQEYYFLVPSVGVRYKFNDNR